MNKKNLFDCIKKEMTLLGIKENEYEDNLRYILQECIEIETEESKKSISYSKIIEILKGNVSYFRIKEGYFEKNGLLNLYYNRRKYVYKSLLNLILQILKDIK